MRVDIPYHIPTDILFQRHMPICFCFNRIPSSCILLHILHRLHPTSYYAHAYLRAGMHTDNPKAFDKERTWNRLVSGAKFGDVLITVSTGEMAENVAEHVGLVPTHAYAVLDVREVEGKRLLQVKNPWSHRRWKGAFSPQDKVNWTPSLRAALQYDQVAALQYDNGIFWIDYNSMLAHFKGLYLNWNRDLFAHHTALHAHWPTDEGPKNDTYNIGYNPQYTLNVVVPEGKGGKTKRAASAAVWLLLSRHVVRKESEDSKGDFLTLHVYNKTDGRRVYHPHGAMISGTYSNNPHTLIRFNAPPGKHAFTLVVSQYERQRDISFTLDVFSTAPFSLKTLAWSLPHRITSMEEWTSETAGGSARSARFMFNPQLRLTLDRPITALRVFVEAPVKFAVNVRLISGGGKRVSDLSATKEIASSGDYHRGFCVMELHGRALPAGSYTIVPSTYEPKCIGRFRMIVEAAGDVAPRLGRIAPEGAGMKTQTIRGAWKAGSTAVGCHNYGRYNENPRHLCKPLLSRTKVVMRLTCEVPGTALNLSVYRCDEGGRVTSDALSIDASFATTNKGVYTNPVCGVTTGDISMADGYFLIVPSTFEPVAVGYVLTIHSDSKVTFFS